MGKAGNYYEEDENFSGFEGAGKPRNPKGLFVVPTGSVSMIKVSSSIKGGSVGSTKDTLNLLTNLGTEYDEPWHEAVHYLDKRVSELSIGLNAVADSNTNFSGSSGNLGASNKVKIFRSSASFSTRVTLNDTKATNVSTNLSAATHASQITLKSSDGDNIVIAQASDSIAGIMTVAHHNKLDGIEASATADQTDAEIRTAVEAATDSNVFTDADHTKLNGIESSATADQSNAEILTAIEDGVDSVHYKNGSIDTEHIGDDQVTAAKLANSINSAIAANTAKVTNSDQSKADINALDITEVGTISSGVWQGTTIKTAYIGDDQITEDKLANTLLAEIDANTAKVTNSDQSKADINALDITEVGTISSGVWQGTTIKTAYIGDDQVTEDKLANTLLAEIDANTAKVGTTSTERSRIAANHAKVGITTSQASAITANTAKIGTEVDLTGNASEGIILKAVVGKSKTGAYSMKFTMTDSSGRETVQKSATINLE